MVKKNSFNDVNQSMLNKKHELYYIGYYVNNE